MNGELVGITSSGYSGTNTNFAVPVDTVKYVNLISLNCTEKVRHISFWCRVPRGLACRAGSSVRGRTYNKRA